MISANTRKRIHAISIEGSVADRYFAVTSEAPRNIVDARISAMPLNGRSARAGALGALALAGALAAADFFSGKGNGALSSLAATAGGGVTAISKGNNYRIGRSFKKGHLDGNDKVWKRDTDMRDCARRPAAAGAAPLSQYFVKNCVPQARLYNIGRPRGFGPRGKALSSAAISLSLSFSFPAAALSAACSALEAFGIANTDGERVRKPSAT